MVRLRCRVPRAAASGQQVGVGRCNRDASASRQARIAPGRAGRARSPSGRPTWRACSTSGPRAGATCRCRRAGPRPRDLVLVGERGPERAHLGPVVGVVGAGRDAERTFDLFVRRGGCCSSSASSARSMWRRPRTCTVSSPASSLRRSRVVASESEPAGTKVEHRADRRTGRRCTYRCRGPPCCTRPASSQRPRRMSASALFSPAPLRPGPDACSSWSPSDHVAASSSRPAASKTCVRFNSARFRWSGRFSLRSIASASRMSATPSS